MAKTKQTKKAAPRKREKPPVKAARQARKTKSAPARKAAQPAKPKSSRPAAPKRPGRRTPGKPAATRPAGRVVKAAARAKKSGGPASPPRTPSPAARPPRQATRKSKPAKRLTRKQMESFKKLLLNIRDSIVDEITFLTGENLNSNQRENAGDLSNYGLHMADQGTDNFDREFALNLASNGQEVLYEIEEALQRIEAGTYGICEMTGQPIESERLKVLPYARLCREAQEEQERMGRRRRMLSRSSSYRIGSIGSEE